jgi:hypothetical protein
MSDKVELIAAAQVNAFGGPTPGINFNSNFGFKTASRNSAGLYELDLDDKHDGKKLVVQATLCATTDGEIVVSPGSTGDTRRLQVGIFAGGVAADAAFFITVLRVRD